MRMVMRNGPLQNITKK